MKGSRCPFSETGCEPHPTIDIVAYILIVKMRVSRVSGEGVKASEREAKEIQQVTNPSKRLTSRCLAFGRRGQDAPFPKQVASLTSQLA